MTTARTGGESTQNIIWWSFQCIDLSLLQLGNNDNPSTSSYDSKLVIF